MKDILFQIIIILSSTLALWLVNGENVKARRYGCLIGVIGQPFWLIETYQAAQWGMLIVSILYTAGWMRGIYHQWIRPWYLDVKYPNVVAVFAVVTAACLVWLPGHTADASTRAERPPSYVKAGAVVPMSETGVHSVYTIPKWSKQSARNAAPENPVLTWMLGSALVVAYAGGVVLLLMPLEDKRDEATLPDVANEPEKRNT